MQFRCPNCQHAIQVLDEKVAKVGESVECPSCHSRISISADVGEATNVPEKGMLVAHYEVTELLGEGAFGTVYKAWDPQLSRFVAIKLPRAGSLHKDESRQFLREARAASSIHHPNIVAVYEVGQHEGRYYIATQFIDGVTLRDHLKSGGFPARESAVLIIKLLRAAQVFHDQGIIHRDLKPGNILLDLKHEPHIADFGLARRENPGELTVTQSGHVIGTLLYMPPEQARGEQSSVTNRSDVYSIGVILYEMLTGHRPFQATSSRTLLYSILTAEARAPRKLNAKIPRDLETICLKAIQKESIRRYVSASEMADDLQRFLDGKPILARPVGRAEKMAKFVGRNRLVSTLVVALVAAITRAAASAVRSPAGTVAVRMLTDPPEAQLTFIRYDQQLRVPARDGFVVRGSADDALLLHPGVYKVIAIAADDRSTFHEVWRFVPESTKQNSGEQRFPHRAWTVNTAGEIELQTVKLFSAADITEPMVSVKGGQFEAGNEDQPGGLQSRHSQSVQDLLVGIHEVSSAQFRTVMNQPIRSPLVEGTYLEWLNVSYGDRSAVPDKQPVTGYPADIAVLYAELAGGRLPTGIEWEYLATNGGTAKYPSGETVPLEPDSQRDLLLVDQITTDSTENGVRNLYLSAAEFTDSRVFAYTVLYPDLFPDVQMAQIDSLLIAQMPEMVELRGGSAPWVLGASDKSGDFSVRDRLVAPLPVADSDAAVKLGRIGWRLFRSTDPPES